MNINKVSLRDLFDGIGGIKQFKKTMTLEEYYMIRRHLMFHDIRKDKMYKETIKEIIENTKIEMNELDDLSPIENDYMNLEEKTNEIELKNCNFTSLIKDISLVEQFKVKSNIIMNYLKNYRNKIELLIIKRMNKNNDLMKYLQSLNEELEQEIENISNLFKELINYYKSFTNDTLLNELETNKILNNEYIINENIIKELNSIMSKKINKPTRIIVKKLKFVINDYIPNIFKNVKKSVINEYNYVIKYNENKELLLNEIGMEDLNFDLYDENKDDGSYLIIDVLRIFNSCLKETKVMDYGNSFSIDETLSYCSCRTKFIQKIPRKPVGKGI